MSEQVEYLDTDKKKIAEEYILSESKKMEEEKRKRNTAIVNDRLSYCLPAWYWKPSIDTAVQCSGKKHTSSPSGRRTSSTIKDLLKQKSFSI